MIKLRELKRETAFSYACGRCQSCCRGRRVYVNPFEVATLAAGKGVSTTELIESHIDKERFALKQTEDGSCTFLVEGACGVHGDRPLACRLYPLARRSTVEGTVQFAELTPEPDTKGVYGEVGVVDDYLKSQGTELFEQIADEYFKVFSTYAASLPEPTSAAELIRNMFSEQVPVQQRLLMDPKIAERISSLFDIDKTLAGESETAAQSVEEKTRLHLSILLRRLSG